MLQTAKKKNLMERKYVSQHLLEYKKRSSDTSVLNVSFFILIYLLLTFINLNFQFIYFPA